MTFDLRRTLLKRLRDGLDMVNALELERAAASLAHAEARGAVADARAALKCAEARLRLAELTTSSIEARCEAAERVNQEARIALGTMSTFPSDLLTIIFGLACAPIRPFDLEGRHWQPNTGIDRTAMIQPYRIAGVCRKWRRLALDCGALWSYIAVPSTIGDHFGEHLERCLERSRAAPLNIVIRVSESGIRGKTLDHIFSSLFPDLMQNAGRIRTLSAHAYSGYRFDMPESLVTGVVDLLRCPTPQLLDLDLVAENSRIGADEARFLDPSTCMPQFLPYAPRLRRLNLKDFPIICWAAHPGLPNLTTLTYHSSPGTPTSTDHFLAMVSLAPQLRHLDLRLWDTRTRPVLDEKWITRLEGLPLVVKLELLTGVEGILFNPSIELPNLTSLRVHSTDLLQMELSQTMTRQLTSLSLTYEIAEEHVLIFRQLKAVERFELDGNDEGSPDLDQDPFFNALCDDDDPLWPLLRHIGLFNRSKIVEPHAPDGQSGLLKVVMTRLHSTLDGSGDSGVTRRPRAIESLEFDEEAVPLWEAIHLQSILGDKCHRIVY